MVAENFNPPTPDPEAPRFDERPPEAPETSNFGPPPAPVESQAAPHISDPEQNQSSVAVSFPSVPPPPVDKPEQQRTVDMTSVERRLAERFDWDDAKEEGARQDFLNSLPHETQLQLLNRGTITGLQKQRLRENFSTEERLSLLEQAVFRGF